MLISRLRCPLEGRGRVMLTAGTTTASAYGRRQATERFHCTYGLEPRYEAEILGWPLLASGVGEDGEVRAVELGYHPFFVATLFLPQLSSTRTSPHPLVMAFLRAAAADRDDRCTLGGRSRAQTG